MTRRKLIWDVMMGLISGPVLSALLLLVPLGVLTGVSVVMDPSLAITEFTAVEELIIPFVLIAAFISAANVRLAVVMSKDEKPGRLFEISTDRYAGDQSGAENIHGHPGKQLAEEFIRFLERREGGAVEIGAATDEDYGWGLWIGEKGFSPLWVAVAHAGPSETDETKDGYILAITLETPLAPWRRLFYRPDFALRDRMENHLVDFLATRGVGFTSELAEWGNPEPKTSPAARF